MRYVVNHSYQFVYLHSIIYHAHSGNYFGRFEHIHVEMNKHMLSTSAFYPSQQFVAILPYVLRRKVVNAVLLLSFPDFITFPIA